MSAWLEQNLRALRAANPAVAAAVEAAAPLPGLPEPTPAGEPTLRADGVLLHNARDPRAEAARWAAAQLERLEAAGADATAVVLGFGLGYHVETLAGRFSGRVLVIEPDLALLRTALGARDLRPLLGRVTLASGMPSDRELEAWRPVVALPHAPSVLREGDALRGLRERIAARAALHGLRLRVLVVSPLAGGSWPITGYCARALAALGHEVSVLDLSPFAGAMDGIARFTPKAGARRLVEGAFGRFLATGILAAVEAAQPDLLLAMAQAPLDATVLREIGQRGVLRAFWFVEDHRLFPYWQEVIPHYDHFFVIQQGDFLSRATAATAGRVSYLPLAADPLVHRPLALTPVEQAELAAPLAFVGAGYRNRRLAFRPLLDEGLRIWGTEWQGAGAVEAAVQRGGARISTDDCVRIFNASTINLNLHSSTYLDGVDPRGDFVNPRTFELAAAGAFQLTDQRALLPPLFEPGREIVTFDDAGALRELVRHWLARPLDRQEVAAAARMRALAEHTYQHRMTALLEAVCARDGERLAARPRVPTVAEVAREEGPTPLGKLLRGLPATTPFTLDGVARQLFSREGDVSDAEAILLFLHQFDELYVKDARA